MNAPFAPVRDAIRLGDLRQPDEAARIERFVADSGGSLFHRPAWLRAVEAGTGQRAHGVLVERSGRVRGWLPLSEVHSPIFGRILASSGFAVGGGPLAESPSAALSLCHAAEELAARLSCTTIECRGGEAPTHWVSTDSSHCSFDRDLAPDDEAQLLAIPRKQRAEVRKGLNADLTVDIGRGEADRVAHHAVYRESVRNLGTPVFPRSLFDAALDALDGDILTVRHRGLPIASVLSFYHDGAVMPYWGGGTNAARALRGNDRMYFELMLHARRRGCSRFDFGRSKTDSGAFHFKRNWGFDPQPLTYSSWTAPGFEARNTDPRSDRHAARIAAWQKLPLAIANRIGPMIARGLG